MYLCTFSFHRNDLLVLDTPPPIQSKQKASKVHFGAVNEYEHFSDIPESNTVSPYVCTYVHIHIHMFICVHTVQYDAYALE